MPELAVIRNLRIFMHAPPDAVPNIVSHYRSSRGLRMLLQAQPMSRDVCRRGIVQ
jgi:hypothetical protein